jgi:hypothetical protein
MGTLATQSSAPDGLLINQTDLRSSGFNHDALVGLRAQMLSRLVFLSGCHRPIRAGSTLFRRSALDKAHQRILKAAVEETMPHQGMHL